MDKFNTLAIGLSMLGIAILLGAVTSLANAAQDTFTVSVTVSNSAPVVDSVNSGFTYTPVADSTTTFYFQFNATDANGAADLNDTTATVLIEQGAQSATSNSCTVTDSGNTARYNCSVDIPYYFDATTWSINASVSDNSAAYAENTSQTFTVGEVKGMDLTQVSLSFIGSPGQNDRTTAEGPQRVRNTGNFDFPELNLTGYDLEGTTHGDIIGVSNFSVNVSDSATGQALVNGSAVTISGASMTHGQAANETLYLYLDIPASVRSDTYNGQAAWVIDAN